MNNCDIKRVLVVIISHSYHSAFDANLRSWDKLFPGTTTDYAAVLSENNKEDFINIERALGIPLKYRMCVADKQIHKLWQFISSNDLTEYDWFVKMRPEMRLLDTIPLSDCIPDKFNGRARVYRGPKHVKHGMSVMGPGCWGLIVSDYSYNEHEVEVVMDDQMFMFDRAVVSSGVFGEIDIQNTHWPEHNMTKILTKHGVQLSVIGLNVELYDTVKHRTALSGSF